MDESPVPKLVPPPLRKPRLAACKCRHFLPRSKTHPHTHRGTRFRGNAPAVRTGEDASFIPTGKEGGLSSGSPRKKGGRNEKRPGGQASSRTYGVRFPPRPPGLGPLWSFWVCLPAPWEFCWGSRFPASSARGGALVCPPPPRAPLCAQLSNICSAWLRPPPTLVLFVVALAVLRSKLASEIREFTRGGSCLTLPFWPLSRSSGIRPPPPPRRGSHLSPRKK